MFDVLSSCIYADASLIWTTDLAIPDTVKKKLEPLSREEMQIVLNAISKDIVEGPEFTAEIEKMEKQFSNEHFRTCVSYFLRIIRTMLFAGAAYHLKNNDPDQKINVLANAFVGATILSLLGNLIPYQGRGI